MATRASLVKGTSAMAIELGAFHLAISMVVNPKLLKGRFDPLQSANGSKYGKCYQTFNTSGETNSGTLLDGDFSYIDSSEVDTDTSQDIDVDYSEDAPIRVDQIDIDMNKSKFKAPTSSSQPVSREIDGLQAWLTLACVFIVNANTLGSLKVYGLIFEKIVSENYYNREEASWPISTASTIQNLAGLFTPLLSLKISWRSIEILQTVLFVAANAGAYFSSGLAVDLLCLGVVQGVALSLRYNMNIVINNEYFAKYRATAMGVSLAGSTCGVFVLKPIIAYVLDRSGHEFRYAYLTLAAIVSINLPLNLFIRKPLVDNQEVFESTRSIETSSSEQVRDRNGRDESLKNYMIKLLRNPNIHCIWIMQTVYFYISRTYTIFIVDYGVEKGFSRLVSRDFLTFWVYGEILGRLILGSFVDSRILSLKCNIIVVNLILGLFGISPLLIPLFLDADAQKTNQDGIFWYLGVSFALVAALSSLVNMMIVPFGQEYLGKKNVPWAFAMGSVVTSVFLLFRPSLIGLSKDYNKSYNLLISVMSLAPLIYAILFALLEPLLARYKFREKT